MTTDPNADLLGDRAIHTIPVPRGWSPEQAWEAISRGEKLTDPEPFWANIEVDERDRFVRLIDKEEDE